MIFKSQISEEKMRSFSCILVLVVLSSSSTSSGKTIQKVVYHEGPVEAEVDKDSSSSDSLEEIPPREQWFMVKGDHPEPNQNHLPRARPLAQGEREIVVLPTASARNPTRVVFSNAVGSHHRSDLDHETEHNQDDQEIVEEEEERSSPRNGNSRMINVNVRSRGQIGFQREDNERRQVFARRGGEGEEWEHFTKAPPLSKRRNKEGQGQQQNWHLHIRHEGGHHDSDRDSDVGQSEISKRPQQPREPDEEVEMVAEGKERSRVTQQTPRRDEDYEYDGVNSAAKNSNSGNGRRVEALAVHQYGSGQKRVVSLKSHTNDYYDEDYEDSPPPHDQVAKMARYIVRKSNWTAIATISTMASVKGYPFVNIASISDGPNTNSSGIPYMYLTPLDMSAIDLRKDPRASLTMSLAQSDYCRQQEYDPEDPRCAKVILSGRIVPVTNKAELQYARNAVYSRHPEMQSWPKDHNWFFAKLDISNVVVLDYFGGAKTVKLDDYFNVPSL